MEKILLRKLDSTTQTLLKNGGELRFNVITSIKLLGTLGLVAALLALYHPYNDKNKLYNIVSTDKYIIHYAEAALIVLYIFGKFTVGKFESSLL